MSSNLKHRFLVLISLGCAGVDDFQMTRISFRQGDACEALHNVKGSVLPETAECLALGVKCASVVSQRSLIGLPTRFARWQRGVGLVELMVALVIGSLAAIVMMQIFALSEGRKRTLTSGADAQTTANVALYLMERDLRQAGYGLAPAITDYADVLSTTKPAAGTKPVKGILVQCPTVVANTIEGTGGRAGKATFSYTNSSFAPVVINPVGFDQVGDANSDVILVNYSGTNGVLASGREYTLGGAKDIQMPNVAGFQTGDVFLAISSSSCAIGQVTKVATGSLEHDDTGRWNKSTIPSSGVLYNLGPVGSLVSRVYAVRAGNLVVCDLTASDCTNSGKANDAYWAPVATGVVGLLAQYGKSTDYKGIVTDWDKVQLTGAEQMQVISLRLALFARSTQYEKSSDFTATQSNDLKWRKDASGTEDAYFSTEGFAEDWQHYRYNVAQTLVPLRNLIWGLQQ